MGATHTRDVLVIFFAVLLMASSRLGYRCLLLPLSIILGLYYPVAHNYGAPNYQQLISLVATNPREGEEFLSLLPVKDVVIAFVIPPLVYFGHKGVTYLKLQPHRNKSLVLVYVLLVLFSLDPWGFRGNVQRAFLGVNQEIARLKEGHQNMWGNDFVVSGQYEDYVLVIGESARRDYFNVYGYPLGNTPFLSSSKGVFVDGLIAADTYTVGSLKLALTKSDNGAPDYNRSVVDLANRNGFRTVWISNQGAIGKHDTPISKVASQADFVYFVNPNDFGSSSLPDSSMLPIFKDEISKRISGKRLIVLHLMGSHSDACKRVRHLKKRFEVSDQKRKYVECYVSSILATDNLIEQVVSSLNMSGRKWSLLYFSDHGLSHNVDEDGNVRITHADPGAFSLDVPLFRLSSDDSFKKVVSSTKDGRKLLYGIASWMGISGGELLKYDLFDGVSDNVSIEDISSGIRKDKKDYPLQF